MDVKVTFGALKRRIQPWLDGETLGENGGSPLDLLFGNTLRVVRDRRAAFKEWIHSSRGVRVWDPQLRQAYHPDSISAEGIAKRLNSKSDTAEGKDLAAEALARADDVFVEDQDLFLESEEDSGRYDSVNLDSDSADRTREMPVVDASNGSQNSSETAFESLQTGPHLATQQPADEFRHAKPPPVRNGWPANQARRTAPEESIPR